MIAQSSENHELLTLLVWAKNIYLTSIGLPLDQILVTLNTDGINRFGKMSSASSGFPPILLPLRGPSHGMLALRLKPERGGRMTENQRIWMSRLSRLGHKATLCHGAKQAQAIITEYLTETGHPFTVRAN